MDVAGRPGGPHLERDETANAVHDQRAAVAVIRPVGGHDDVALQLVAVRLGRRREVRAADLLFALDQQLHTDRKAPGGCQRPRRHEVGDELSLVVACPPAVEGPVPDGGLEGWSRPGFDGVGRLDVVVTVKEDRWGRWRSRDLGVDDRRPRSCPQLDAETAALGQGGDRLGGRNQLVSGGRDARYLDQRG